VVMGEVFTADAEMEFEVIRKDMSPNIAKKL
jgi:hypothetical protein